MPPHTALDLHTNILMLLVLLLLLTTVLATPMPHNHNLNSNTDTYTYTGTSANNTTALEEYLVDLDWGFWMEPATWLLICFDVVSFTALVWIWLEGYEAATRRWGGWVGCGRGRGRSGQGERYVAVLSLF
jgi:hypothetical protein